MKNIDHVLEKMDALVDQFSQEQHRLGYFAGLYRQVTIRVKEGIGKNEFEDNPRMEKLVCLFAQRYFDALETFKQGEKPTTSWLRTFESAQSSAYMVLQHLILGINAHINLDLGIAAVETAGIGKLETIKGDFDKINLILGEMVDGVKKEIGKISPIFKLMMRLAKGRDIMLVNFSIQIARNGAWKFAQEYAQAEDQGVCIGLRDQVIAGLAESLLNPGKRLSLMFKVVAFTERRSVAKTISLLENLAISNKPARI
ncbi:DUF5995 family protein [Pararhodonellum marinum]|uniref:DUF5995 family protein n=1 Tax=Pararhodonellum marinum TaxID=2755358 RepID=UPI00188E9D7B|nr:DUF5995 family protein [Pararhodonellum marinum]